MQKLINTPYLKEKGFLGPFSLIEALVAIAICCLTYIISCYCEDWLHYNRLCTISFTSFMMILSFLVKIFLRNSNPTWLSSMISYNLLHLAVENFSIKYTINAFLKENKERRLK